MKSKEKQTLAAMTTDEIKKVLIDAQNALDILVLNKPSKNVREGRALKRKIAVIQTLMRQKELTHE
jgi:ribosomal protein L29